MDNEKEYFMRKAIELARNSIKFNKGGPFGAVVVKNGKIIGEGNNQVTSTNDPTAHAEIVAIRDACRNLNSFQLNDCELYTSCEPCPMCLGAIYWARPKAVYFASTRKDAANIGFDDDFIYKEIVKDVDDRDIVTRQLLRDEAQDVFLDWEGKKDRVDY